MLGIAYFAINEGLFNTFIFITYYLLFILYTINIILFSRKNCFLFLTNKAYNFFFEIIAFILNKDLILN